MTRRCDRRPLRTHPEVNGPDEWNDGSFDFQWIDPGNTWGTGYFGLNMAESGDNISWVGTLNAEGWLVIDSWEGTGEFVGTAGRILWA